MGLKTTFISDTHTQHRKLNLKGGDLLIHAGDLSSRGYKKELEDFLEWFTAQPYKHKVFISGNHDFCFQDIPQWCKETIQQYTDDSVHYLQDSGVTIEGYKIWGSPWQPWFYNWAFNLQRGPQLKEKWDLIPRDTDILITHGPPYGFHDFTTYDKKHVGCEELIKAIHEIKPKINVFGHIHEAAGHSIYNDTLFVNASVLNLKYDLVNQPVNIEFDSEKKIHIL